MIAGLRVRGIAIPSLATLLVAGLAADGLLLRLIDLGAKAMHHDESLHAMFAWYLAEGRGYRHDPLMHGPLQFHVLAACYWLIGDSEFSARLFAALTGTALIATPLLLRRWLGGAGTVIVAFFFALSPTLLYFSRFARNDVPVALFTTLSVIAIWRYRDDGRARWLLLLAGAIALHFSAKETVYLAEGVLLLYLEVVLWRALLAQHAAARPAATPAERARVAAALLPTAWLVAALWPLLPGLRTRLGLGTLPREGDLLVVLGTVTVVQLSAAVQLPLTALGVTLEGDARLLVGGVTAAALVGGAVAIGTLWDPRRFVPAFALFAAITVVLYTTVFTNPSGLASGFWGGLDYWLDQQAVRRGEQPWFYYLMLLPAYELWALVPAAIGGVWLIARGNRFAAMLGWWLVGTFAALSVAGEKMPWLTVHLALPLALLGGHALGQLLPRLREALSGERVSGRAWLAASAVSLASVTLVALALRTTTNVSFRHPDVPVEPLIYTQTAPDVPRLSAEIIGALRAPGGPTAVAVDTTASLAWPWAWYLRAEEVAYLEPEAARRGEVPERAILILASHTLPGRDPLRERYQPGIPYHHRWWFPEEGYRAATAGGIARGLLDGALARAWLDFLVDRIDASRLGSLDGEVLFPRPPVAAGG